MCACVSHTPTHTISAIVTAGPEVICHVNRAPWVCGDSRGLNSEKQRLLWSLGISLICGRGFERSLWSKVLNCLWIDRTRPHQLYFSLSYHAMRNEKSPDGKRNKVFVVLAYPETKFRRVNVRWRRLPWWLWCMKLKKESKDVCVHPCVRKINIHLSLRGNWKLCICEMQVGFKVYILSEFAFPGNWTHNCIVASIVLSS